MLPTGIVYVLTLLINIMKLKFLAYLPVAIVGLFIADTASAQDSTAVSAFKTWSIGASVGSVAPIGPFGGQNDFSNFSIRLGYGVFIKKQITPVLSVRADAFRGDLKGRNTGAAPVASFQTDINWAASVSAELNLLNLSLFKQQNNALLYANAGGGLVNYSVTTNVSPQNTVQELVIPVGVGFRYRLSPSLNLDLGITGNFVDADSFDGYNVRGNDKYTYAHAGLEYAIGKAEKQLAFYSPIAATYDEALAAKATANALKADLDAQKEENTKLRTEMGDLLKDTDGDGVADKLDKCAGTPAGTVVDGSGCPLKVPAPQVQVTERVIVTEADRKVVADAISNLEFDLGKATIRAKSFPTLNRVAALLVEKNFSLKLAGHTDNSGSDALNLRLSKDRAEAVRTYLSSKGANESRIEAVGYGETQPIAPNITPEGRQQNRRVEFTIF